ncbi:hypothetical protein CEUSTIGMA_g5875.t1 [Chlamydomonas eustigma]|uniref:Uncharacterized protein n=1 Tax=Chlamydomonas eustigma TaxID=1157962 RepID=A0A250X5R6_9CHLO|nr:hypothetical protein CEUSTIGMA_g5875.t1 [Chlamydomonas eustigma]|eukprot:GAX78434.1 hypothetical protein CEUSTIGMA_g5875.t1 [Chlamydomonas eustigma]
MSGYWVVNHGALLGGMVIEYFSQIDYNRPSWPRMDTLIVSAVTITVKACTLLLMYKLWCLGMVTGEIAILVPTFLATPLAAQLLSLVHLLLRAGWFNKAMDEATRQPCHHQHLADFSPRSGSQLALNLLSMFLTILCNLLFAILLVPVVVFRSLFNLPT